MSHRLASGGRLIDRSRDVTFTFNGKTMKGHAGDTLAASLLANGQTLLGRSFKYHRPRGIVASGAEEPNALVGLGKGDRYEPNQRVTTTELFEGMSAETQNHWPSLGIRPACGEQPCAAIPDGGFLLQDLPAPARVLEACV